MSRRRGASGLSGILLVDKPEGLTSHDVVDKARRATGERRVGHAGTLDPMATGLLVVLIGPATRLAPYLTSAEKTYEATIRFGSATDTDDAEGEVVRESAVPADAFDAGWAQSVLDGLLGGSMQRPPAYSAIKVDGRVAHRAARGGEELVLADRPIDVIEAQLLSLDADAAEWHVRFTVSKGTYIRSLARDLGERMGSAAHLSGLRRTASGHLPVGAAHSLEEVAEAGERGDIASLFADPTTAFDALPRIQAAEKDVMSGRPLPVSADVEESTTLVAVFVEGDRLAALYRLSGDRLVAEVVIATPLMKGVAS